MHLKNPQRLMSGKNSELIKYLLDHTHLQNKVQCMNNNVYVMHIWVKESPTKTVNVSSAGATMDGEHMIFQILMILSVKSIHV